MLVSTQFRIFGPNREEGEEAEENCSEEFHTSYSSPINQEE
jgi:hypothetical protein